jgi:membrane protease YdiL (CAAX protease family)
MKLSYRFRFTFLLIVFQLPILLLYLKKIDYSERYWVLCIFFIILITYTFTRKFSLKELGFQTTNLKKSFYYNFLFALILITFLIIGFKLGLIREPTIPDWGFFFIFYVFVSSPVQEFIFRSFIFAELRRFQIKDNLILIISTINYSLMHAFYHDWIIFFSSLFVGFCFGWIYLKTNNLYGISLSHALVGSVSIYVGLI